MIHPFTTISPPLFFHYNTMHSSYENKSEPLTIKTIPGTYGLPFIGPIKDRWDYFYNQGEDAFFRTRIQKYGSTVFRTNMPPGPFISPNSKVVTVLDSVSFQILFDTSKVEKKDVLDGTYVPSTSFTGGYRTLAYLDPSEPNHGILKGFFMSVIASLHQKLVPSFRTSLSEFFGKIENELTEKSKADFNALSDVMAFDFVFRLFCNRSAAETEVGTDGDEVATGWLALQLVPLMTLGIKYLPNCIEDLIIHTFPLPYFLIKSKYKNIYDAFYANATDILDDAEKLGINRDEACQNLVFIAEFNAFGGMKTLFPALIKWIGSAGETLHAKLVDEVRTVVKSDGVTLASLNKMPLVKSVVYEALRIEPPVPYQYGKAKEDLVINSHDASYNIKKGEMLFGFQPLATKDPKVFANPEEFIGDRFVGDGEELLKYVYWSNGRETENPTADNKQCPGKDMVVVLSRLMVVDFFLRYDSLTVESAKIMLGSAVTITSLTKAK